MTDRVRQDVFAAYNIDYSLHANYELDHLVPLELGGDNAVANLWPEPRHASNSASVKDHLENHLHALVCAGQVPLVEAQRAMEGDWLAADAKYEAMGATSRPAVRPAVPPPPVARPAPRGPSLAPAPPVPAPAPPVVAPVPVPTQAAPTFANCAELRGTYPHGVGMPGAHDQTSGTPVTTFFQSADVYNANRDHDADGDGIACEHR